MANKKKPKKKLPEPARRPMDFLDSIAPAAAKFNTDHFILGSRYHTVLSLKSYPPMTDELALLRRIGDIGGVSLRLTARQSRRRRRMLFCTPRPTRAAWSAATSTTSNRA